MTSRRIRIRQEAPDTARLTARGLAAYIVLVGLVTLLGAVGALPRWPGMLHLVALPPLDLAADLRWLLARAPSTAAFVLGVVVSLTARTTVLALLIGRRGRPSWRLALTFYLAAVGPLLVAAQFDFMARAALYSRLFGAGLGVLALAFGVLAGAMSSRQERLSAALRENFAAGLRVRTLVVYAVVLVLLGALAQASGPIVTVVLVPVSGALTLSTLIVLRGPRPRRPWVQLAAAGLLGLALWGMVVQTRGDAPLAYSEAQREGSALVMSGINSASGEGAIFELDPARIGFTCEQFHYFSYAGAGEGQPQGSAACPKQEGAPYQPHHTQRPFSEQVQLLGEQVEPLEPPVTVLAHSQAAWVAWEAAAEGILSDDTILVLVGPFPSSPIGFPRPGQRGPGRVGGELFRLVEPVPELVDFDFEVDAPLSRELLATPDAAGEVFARPLPGGVQALALTATSDLALMPTGWRLAGATNACPIREAHPYLPLTPALHQAVDRFLDGGRPHASCAAWPELYRRASQAFGAPPHGS